MRQVVTFTQAQQSQYGKVNLWQEGLHTTLNLACFACSRLHADSALYYVLVYTVRTMAV